MFARRVTEDGREQMGDGDRESVRKRRRHGRSASADVAGKAHVGLTIPHGSRSLLRIVRHWRIDMTFCIRAAA